jgi:hypothetical protein
MIQRYHSLCSTNVYYIRGNLEPLSASHWNSLNTHAGNGCYPALGSTWQDWATNIVLFFSVNFPVRRRWIDILLDHYSSFSSKFNLSSPKYRRKTVELVFSLSNRTAFEKYNSRCNPRSILELGWSPQCYLLLWEKSPKVLWQQIISKIEDGYGAIIGTWCSIQHAWFLWVLRQLRIKSMLVGDTASTNESNPMGKQWRKHTQSPHWSTKSKAGGTSSMARDWWIGAPGEPPTVTKVNATRKAFLSII